MTILSDLAGRVKAWLIIAGVAVAALGIVVLKIFSAGRSAERAEQLRKRERALRIAREIENDVAKAGPGELRRRASRWLR